MRSTEGLQMLARETCTSQTVWTQVCCCPSRASMLGHPKICWRLATALHAYRFLMDTLGLYVFAVTRLMS